MTDHDITDLRLPWTAEKVAYRHSWCITDCDGEVIFEGVREDYARQIVVSVNFCGKVEPELLEGLELTGKDQLIALMAENARLREALERLSNKAAKLGGLSMHPFVLEADATLAVDGSG